MKIVLAFGATLCNSVGTMKLTITRMDAEIFRVVSNVAYWSDGKAIDERLAFAGDVLSNSRAQSIERKRGNPYILISPFGIKNSWACETAKSLPIGQSFDWTV